MNDINIDEYFDSVKLDRTNGRIRTVTFLSAAIALCRQSRLLSIFGYLRDQDFDKKAIYETILQTYLFLGFPRMIEAAIAFNDIYGHTGGEFDFEFNRYSPEESAEWYENGIKLCRKVYGKNYETLRNRFMAISPEMFRWMVVEGYGKVLSRPGLSSIERELCEVAALIADQRERQLVSHIMGALNVGASLMLIKQINDDIKPLAGDEAHHLAAGLITRIELKNDPSN